MKGRYNYAKGIQSILVFIILTRLTYNSVISSFVEDSWSSQAFIWRRFLFSFLVDRRSW